MKYSAATLSALAALVAAQPHFLNSAFDVQEDEPFTLKYDGCESGCTISLQTGDSQSLSQVKVLSSDATGDSTDVTIENIPSGTYAFKIVDNASGEKNYSGQFQYEGTGDALTTSAAETTVMTSSVVSTTVMTTTVATETTMATTATETTVTETSAAETTTGTTTTGSDETSTDSPTATPTVPDNGAARMSSPIALVGGAIAAMFFLW